MAAIFVLISNIRCRSTELWHQRECCYWILVFSFPYSYDTQLLTPRRVYDNNQQPQRGSTSYNCTMLSIYCINSYSCSLHWSYSCWNTVQYILTVVAKWTSTKTLGSCFFMLLITVYIVYCCTLADNWLLYQRCFLLHLFFFHRSNWHVYDVGPINVCLVGLWPRRHQTGSNIHFSCCKYLFWNITKFLLSDPEPVL